LGHYRDALFDTGFGPAGNGFFLGSFAGGVNPSGNTFENNKAHDNAADGFFLQDGASGNSFENNKAHDNADDGFFVEDGASGNTFEDNKAEENGGFGFHDDSTGGAGDLGTDNFYDNNECGDNTLGDSEPVGLCD